MHIKKLAVAAGAAGAIALSLVTAVPASADYTPGAGDAVGVGSDTVQNIGDFVADGSHLGDPGFNALNQVNKVVNFDATADLNVRLAYGSVGSKLNPDGSATCTPGTGTIKGTGNQNATHADTICQLNPTIVLRRGLRPIQRPNGSGAGASALRKDIDAGTKNIDYSRASSTQGGKFTAGMVAKITVATEDFAMLSSSTSPNMPVGGLSLDEIKKIYSASPGAGLNGFTDPVSGLPATGCVTWNELPGNAAGSTALIKPIYPQVASGTYAFFQSKIGFSALGGCTQGAEENDPEAIDASLDPTNAIEPISGARLNLFLGRLGTTGASNNGATPFPYFVDPSCVYGDATVGTGGTANACGTGVASLVNFPTPVAQAPNVTFYNTPGLSTRGITTWIESRPLFIYFRKAEVDNITKKFEPGISKNMIRTLFANPCSGKAFGNINLDDPLVAAVQCTTEASPTGTGTITYGPGGAPYYASSAGQALISASGAKPTYIYDATGA